MKKRLYYLRKNPLETAFIALLFVIGLIGLPYREIGGLITQDQTLADITGLILCRAPAFAIMCAATYHLGLGGFLPFGKKGAALLFALPALAVALNNAPWIALAVGDAKITASAGTVLLFALECLFVGAFEEVSFRGVVFPLVLQKFGTGVKGRFLSGLLSSAMFGLVHLVNLFGGASFGAVAMQIGYSFLIGAMLAVVFFRGGGILLCAALHAVYNFCGMVVPQLGEGELWNLPTIVITVLLSVAVCAYMAIGLWKADDKPVRALVFRAEGRDDGKESGRDVDKTQTK